MATPQLLDPAMIDVVTDRFEMLGERDRQWQADIAEADDDGLWIGGEIHRPSLQEADEGAKPAALPARDRMGSGQKNSGPKTAIFGV
jgi:hypothetical protein